MLSSISQINFITYIFYDNIGGWLALLFLISVFPFLIFYLHTMVIQINLFNYGNSLCKSYWQTLQHLFLGQHVNDTIILLYDSMILWYLGGSSLCGCSYFFFFFFIFYSHLGGFNGFNFLSFILFHYIILFASC